METLEDGEDMQPIQIDVTTKRKKPEDDLYSLFRKYWPCLLPIFIVAKILGGILFLLVLVYFAGYDINSKSSNSPKRAGFALPFVGLRDQIHASTKRATLDGSLHTRPIRTETIHTELDLGLSFVLCKPSAAQPNTDPAQPDPLNIKDIDESLVVHRFSEDGTGQFSYSLVLNKYNTIPDHALLVSNEFIPQISPVSTVEFALLYWSLRMVDGVGWYNSNKLAGASQKHKHLQLLPKDELWKLRDRDAVYPTLLDDLILPLIEKNTWKPVSFKTYRNAAKSSVHRIVDFDFHHGVLVLDSRAGKASTDLTALSLYAEYLLHMYELLLQHVGVDIAALRACAASPDANNQCETSGAYNLILTEDYMFIVRRSGYLGLLWASSESVASSMRKVGGLQSLQAVAFPAPYPK